MLNNNTHVSHLRSHKFWADIVTLKSDWLVQWFFTRTVGRRLVLLFIYEQYIFFRLNLLFCINIVERKKQQVLFKIKAAKIQSY